MNHSLIAGGLILGALAFACGGKLVGDDSSWSGTASGDTGPSYSPLSADKQTPAICSQGAVVGGSDDSCLTTSISCAGTAEDQCWDYSTPDSLVGGEIEGNGLSTETDGIGHYYVPTPSDQISGLIGSQDPTQFKLSIRMKVSAATGSVTLVRARIDTEGNDGLEQAMTLELTGSLLHMCTPGPANGPPVCVDVGSFGREVWHTMVFSYIGGTASAELDCLPAVTAQYTVLGVPEPDMGVSIDYGIMFPTCASDVFIDAVRCDD